MDHNSLPRITRAMTHAGRFHADDVFSAAVLKLLYPDLIIERSSQVPEGYTGLVFDIGGGPYDHHVGETKQRENGAPYAAFGLLWKTFGPFLLGEDAEEFDRTFIEPLDISDNTGKFNQLSQILADFNRPDAAQSDADFEDAVAFAMTILQNRFAQIRYERSCYEAVRQIYDRNPGRIVVLDRYLSWKKALVDTEAMFVIYPGIRGGFNVQVVPVASDDRTAKKDLPSSWWGKSGRELQETSGIRELVFCHKTGFLCAAQTLEAAVKAAQTALKG